MSKQYSDQTGLACDLTALNPRQRESEYVQEQLRESQQEIREVTNAYTFQYPVEDSVLPLLAEFMDLEIRCCPFPNFALDVKTERGPAWSTLTRPEGV